MIPVTTRLAAVARHGLLPTLRRLLGAGVPGIVLEAPASDRALEADWPGLVALAPPILGAIAPLGTAPGSLASVASADPGGARAAAEAVRATAAAVAPLGGRYVVVTIGPAGLDGEVALREECTSDAADRPALVAAWRARVRLGRERRAEELCRALFGLARGVSPQRLLLLPGPDPLGFADPETMGWVLDDLAPHAVALALDTGWAWAGEASGGVQLRAWLETGASRLGFLFISDHDSSGSGEILPGAGRGDLSGLREAIGKRTPRAIRPDPRASLDDLFSSMELVGRHLGAVGDVVGW